jgi:hypothetical protein
VTFSKSIIIPLSYTSASVVPQARAPIQNAVELLCTIAVDRK